MLQLLFSVILIVIIYNIHVLSKKEKIKEKYSFIIKTFLWIIFLEFTIFNINFYRVYFSKTQQYVYNEQELVSKTNITKDGYKEVIINDINNKVKSIYVEFSNVEPNKIIDYEIYYSDETTIGKFLGTKSYNSESEKTKYTVVDFSRKCK